jgi:hypothetical protein
MTKAKTRNCDIKNKTDGKRKYTPAKANLDRSDSGPEPIFNFNSDQDPTFHFDPDRDPYYFKYCP